MLHRPFPLFCSLLAISLLVSCCHPNSATPATKRVAQKVQEPAPPEYEGQWKSLQLIGGRWTYREHHGWKPNGASADELLCSPRKYFPWSIAIDESRGLDAKTTKLKINLKVWMAASGEPEDRLEPSAFVGLIVGLKSRKAEFIDKVPLGFPVRENGGFGIGLTADHKIQIIDFQSGKLLGETEYPFHEDGVSDIGRIRGLLKVAITQEKKGTHRLAVDVGGKKLSVAIPSSRVSGAIGLLSHPGSTEVDNAESIFSSYSVGE